VHVRIRELTLYSRPTVGEWSGSMFCDRGTSLPSPKRGSITAMLQSRRASSVPVQVLFAAPWNSSWDKAELHVSPLEVSTSHSTVSHPPLSDTRTPHTVHARADSHIYYTHPLTLTPASLPPIPRNPLRKSSIPSAPTTYRATSLARKRTLLGPYSRPMPRILGWS